MSEQRYYVLTISGIPHAFTDGHFDSGSIDGVTYNNYYPHLDLKGGKWKGDQWKLREGKGKPGMLTISVLNVGDVLSTLFATRLASSHQTHVMEDWDFAATVGTTLYVYDHSAFGASGYLYYDLETLEFTGKTNQGGAVTYDRFDSADRAQFGSMGCAHQIRGVGDDDYEANPVVSDHPLRWEGRIVTLWSGAIDSNGALVKPTVDFRGTFVDWKTSKGGGRYTFTIKSTQGILSKKIGVTSGKGAMRTSKSVNLYPSDMFWYICASDVSFAPEDRPTFRAGVYIKWNDGTGTGKLLTSGTYTSIDDIGLASVTHAGYEWAISLSSMGIGNMKVKFQNLSTSKDIVTVQFAPTGLGTALGFDSDIIGPFGQAGDSDDTVEATHTLSKVYASPYTDRLYVENHNIVISSYDQNSLFARNALVVRVKNRNFETALVFRVGPETADGAGDDYFPVLRNSGDALAPIYTEEEEGVSANHAIQSDSIAPSQFISHILDSTDGNAYNGNNDVLPLGWGAELPQAYSRISGGLGDGGGSEVQRWLVDSPTTIGDLLRSVFQLQGWMISQRAGILELARMGEPSVTDSTITLDDGDIMPGSVLGTAQDAGMLINSVVLSANYNLSSDEYDRDKVDSISNQSSIAGGGSLGAMDVEARGVYLRWQENVDEYLEELEDDINSRFGTAPTVVGPLMISRDVGRLDVGDTVYLTSSYIANPATGTIGIVKKPAFVLECDYNIEAGQYTIYVSFGAGWAETAMYAPGAKVLSYVGADLNLDTNYMLPGDDDAEHFQVGDYITIYREADETKYWTGRIIALGVNLISIGAGVTLSDLAAPAAGDKVRYAAWSGSLTAWQKEHAFIADYSTTPPDLGAGDDGKIWK